MTGHLTSQQVTDWRSGVSGAAEILRLDDHLAECAECRALLATPADAAAVALLRREFSSPHWTEAQLDDYAGWRPLPAEAMQHLDICAECRGDADDLRQFAATTKSEKVPVVIRREAPVWLRPMAAIVTLAAVGLSVWLAVGRNRAAAPGAQPPAEMAFEIPPQYRDEVKAAMDSGNLRVPDSIAGMAVGPVQLRGDDARATAFHVISPLATAVVEDAPVFRWTPLEGATYTVSVYDDQFRAVAKSASLTATEWRPEKPLARGAAYRWEVRAVHGKQVESVPPPTEPEARFVILGAEDARRLTAARANLTSQLALGVLYANAGALDDARRELSGAAGSSDPKEKAVAEKLLGQLK